MFKQVIIMNKIPLLILLIALSACTATTPYRTSIAPTDKEKLITNHNNQMEEIKTMKNKGEELEKRIDAENKSTIEIINTPMTKP